jgi:hypothetical protein
MSEAESAEIVGANYRSEGIVPLRGPNHCSSRVKSRKVALHTEIARANDFKGRRVKSPYNGAFGGVG